MASETFNPREGLPADFALAGNWSGGSVPGPGVSALIDGATALIDPATVLRAHLTLVGGATLSGNGGGFSLDGTLRAEGADALYADGAIVNHGAISLCGEAADLRVVVENGVYQAYGLALPGFENAGLIGVAEGATLAVEGTEFSNKGLVILAGGTLAVDGGAVDGGANLHGGAMTLLDGGFASFSAGVSHQAFLFDGAGTLAFADAPQTRAVLINGFGAGDEILAASAAAGEALLDTLHFTNLPAHEKLVVAATQNGAVIELAPAPPCFARGTGILTPAGYARVETLKPGDPVVTLAGDVRAVRWVGARTVDIAAHSRPNAVRPVCFLPGAIGPGQPARRLRLSPDHGLLLRGLLVPAKLLANGATIFRETNCQAVTYYHVELDRHDILLAEGLAAESYLDTGNRGMFERQEGQPRRHPVFGRGRQWDQAAFAPLCLSGPVLRELRDTLRARAGDFGFSHRTLTDVALLLDGRRHLPTGGSIVQPAFDLATPHDSLVTIHSRRFVPAEFSTGAADDYRELGVALSAVRLGRKLCRPAELAVSGFHPRAPGDDADWTDGQGVIRVPPGVRRLQLDIAALPQGWVRF